MFHTKTTDAHNRYRQKVQTRLIYAFGDNLGKEIIDFVPIESCPSDTELKALEFYGMLLYFYCPWAENYVMTDRIWKGDKIYHICFFLLMLFGLPLNIAILSTLTAITRIAKTVYKQNTDGIGKIVSIMIFFLSHGFYIYSLGSLRIS